MIISSALEDEAAVAIRAFDKAFIADLQIDLGVAQRAADAFAGHAPRRHLDDLGRRKGGGRLGIDLNSWLVSLLARAGSYLAKTQPQPGGARLNKDFRR